MIIRKLPTGKKREQKLGDIRGFIVRDIRDKFYMMDNAYLNGYARKCGPYATSVYCALCEHAGHDQSCFPSHKFMADKLGIARNTVMRALEILEYYKIIKINRFMGEHNSYVLLDKACWKIPDDKRISKALTARWKRNGKKETTM